MACGTGSWSRRGAETECGVLHQLPESLCRAVSVWIGIRASHVTALDFPVHVRGRYLNGRQRSSGGGSLPSRPPVPRCCVARLVIGPHRLCASAVGSGAPVVAFSWSGWARRPRALSVIGGWRVLPATANVASAYVELTLLYWHVVCAAVGLGLLFHCACLWRAWRVGLLHLC